ncbi:MAG: hypothetical protein AB1782_16625 [Cyanobacteriota bacterium]
MKKLLLFLVCLSFVSVSVIASTETNRDNPVDGTVADDWTSIQLYYELDSTHRVKIPQETTMLPKEDLIMIFFVYPHHTNNYTVKFTMYELETKIISYTNEKNELVTKNVTDFTRVVSTYNVTVRSGQNEWNDPRFAYVRITSTSWADLQPEDRKTLIVCSYRNVMIKFHHKTDYALVPITITRGEANLNAFYYIMLLLIVVTGSVAFSSMLYFKVGNYWPRPNIAIVVLLIGYFLGAIFIMTLLEANQSLYETQRRMLSFTVIPLEAIIGVIGGWFFLFIPGQFRPKTLGESLLISVNIPYYSARQMYENIRKGVVDPNVEDLLKDQSCKKLILYKYIDKHGRKQYARNPNSYLDLISRLLFGGIKINTEQTIVLKDKNGYDEIIFVIDYSEVKQKKLSADTKKMIYASLGIGIVFTCIIAVFMFYPLALLSLGLVCAGLLFFVWDNITTKYNYEIIPLTRNVLSAIYDSSVVKDLEQDHKLALHEIEQLHRAFVIQSLILKGEWLIEWERKMFPENLTQQYGEDFITEFDKRKQKELNTHDKKKLLEELANIEEKVSMVNQ